LPEPYRTVVLLCDVDALDPDEVASLLGMTPATVRRRLHRARQALLALVATGAGTHRAPADADAGAGRE
jgi:RNA polymerase sigma-70 factor (ECF subfamily)